MNIEESFCCFGCGLIFPEEDVEFSDVEDSDGNLPAVCPDCGSHDIGRPDAGE